MKFISRHKIIFIAAFAVLLVIFLYVPIIIPSSAGGVNTCPYPDQEQFSTLCNLNAPESLFNYLRNPNGPIILD